MRLRGRLRGRPPARYLYPSATAASVGRDDDAPTMVVFHRAFERFQGGHLKVFHYFEHVRSAPSYEARVRFTADSVWDETNPWWALRETVIGPTEAIHADVLFLAGLDWGQLAPEQRARPPVPVVNLIQGLRHLNPAHPLNAFLAHPAIRICIGDQVREALEDDGSATGPIFTVPIALDLARLPRPRPPEERDIDCVILAVKEPPLGHAIAQRIQAAGHGVVLIDSHVPREQLLDSLARARVAVLLPVPVEGAYLPALEAMALETALVCPDCVGNRSFCRDGETCLMPAREERAIADAALTLLEASDEERAPLLAAARAQARSHDLAAERARFLEILARVHELWAGL